MRAKIAALRVRINRLRKRVQRAERKYLKLQREYRQGGVGRPSQARVTAARQTWRNLRDRLEEYRKRLQDLRDSEGTALVTIDGFQVCGWIGRILEGARDDGIDFTVTSGYRSDADQWRVCNTPPYPRPCAPNVPNTPQGRSTSRHRGLVFPDGAVDLRVDIRELTDYCERNNLPLVNAAPADPPHWSSGNRYGLAGY